jgi:hypothetical protein
MARPSKYAFLAIGAAMSVVGCDRAPGDARPAAPASASAVAPAAIPRATLRVDAAHDVMRSKEAPAYAIGPAAELVIELGDHPFAGAGAPDAIHVAHGSAGYYRASFKGKQAVLNAGSLDPVKGREAFPGFEAGESYVVAIGSEAAGPDGAMRFAPAWTAKVSVGGR